MSREPTGGRVSTKAAAALGWSRIDGRGGKLSAVWLHDTGWRLVHCGHPTALTPWDLRAPDGEQIRSGAQYGNADFGTAWPDLASAMIYVGRATGYARNGASSGRSVTVDPRQVELF